MTHATAVERPGEFRADAQPQSRREGWLACVVPGGLLLLQAGLYIWSAPRGFEFTDEAYYVLNYLHWRDLAATVSFFGAYFELPFKLFGQSIFAARILSLIVLLATSAFMTREALSFTRGREPANRTSRLPFVIAGAAGSGLYFGYFSSLRAPSYNLLSLCTMMLATALLFRLVARNGSPTRLRVIALCYGVALGACALSKAPSGALMFGLHAGFFVVANRDWSARVVLESMSLAAAGIALNLVVLQWADPNWLSALRDGVSMTSVVGHGTLLSLASAVAHDTIALAPTIVELSALAVVVALLGRTIRHNRRVQMSIAVVALIACVALELAAGANPSSWLPIVGACIAVLWSFAAVEGGVSKGPDGKPAAVGAVCLLLLLPLAFSFGTNQPVFEHSLMAGVFGIVALLVSLQRLAERRCITKLAVTVSIVLLIAPAIVIQVQNGFNPVHAYRIRTALVDQRISTPIGPSGRQLLLDADTHNEIISLAATGRTVGFPPEEPIFDLTGDGPGLIYALGGRPLGVAWLAGGYSGSETAAARLIARLPVNELRRAWLLTSNTNPRRIRGWQSMLDARLGSGAHERIATIRVTPPTYDWYGKTPDTVDVELWRPRPQ